MSDITTMVRDMTDRLLRDTVTTELVADAESGAWPEALWQRIEESGLPELLQVPRTLGGEAGWADAFYVVHAAGRFALPLPLPEIVAAGGLLGAAGLEAGGGRCGLAVTDPGRHVTLRQSNTGWRVDGALSRVPWARRVTHLVFAATVEGQPMLACAALDGASSTPGQNLVGEPRDDVCWRDQPASVAPCPPGFDADVVEQVAAVLRAAQMAGAIAAVLELAVRHANEREQFGRAIARFQAVQHLLAELAEECAAATVASQQAFAALDCGADLGFAAAVAKVRTGRAAGRAAQIGHQVLAAMGYTREHALHHLTRRLWAWRSEFGAESTWAQRLAARVPPHAAGLWPWVTAAPRPLVFAEQRP